jgi:hypothetical protein
VSPLQKARSIFHKPKPAPQAPMSVTEIDDRVGGSRSKRAKIKDVLRRYEQGVISQAAAVEEFLKMMR